MAIDRFLLPWSGHTYRHVPAGSNVDVLDFRFAGRGRGNRWNYEGERTLYLAGDDAVATAEFGRHLEIDRGADLRLVPQLRQIFRLSLVIDRLLDLRDPRVVDALSLAVAPRLFLDKAVARATARYVRTITPAQGILVPSAAFIDEPEHWVLALFLENLPDDPRRFIQDAVPDGTLRIEP